MLCPAHGATNIAGMFPVVHVRDALIRGLVPYRVSWDVQAARIGYPITYAPYVARPGPDL